MASVFGNTTLMDFKLYERFDEMQLPWETQYVRKEIVTQSTRET